MKLVPARTYKQVMYWRATHPPAKAYWDTVCDEVRTRDDWTCQRCRGHGFVVHHLTYKHLWNEINHTGDLVTLCSKCHRKVHGIPWWKK